MKSKYPELALERILIALERDVLNATDEELLTAARELGMNPSMKGSAAFFGVTRPADLRSWPREIGEQNNAPRGPRRTEGDGKAIEAARAQVHSLLAALTPQQAKALRARFGIDEVGATSDEDEVILHALARELAILQKKP
jgi:hypothetical protein